MEKAKAKVKAHASKVQPKPAAASLREMYAAAGITMPTWKRSLSAFAASMVLAVGIGIAAGELIGWLMIGALTLTNSVFLTLLIYIVGLCVTAYFGMKACGRIAKYVLDEEIDRDLKAAKDKVLGWFKREPSLVAS